MPKAPSDFHPVRNKERLQQRRDYVLREMRENGYITAAVYDREVAQPLRSVQTAIRSSAPRCRRATISPTRSAAS